MKSRKNLITAVLILSILSTLFSACKKTSPTSISTATLSITATHTSDTLSAGTLSPTAEVRLTESLVPTLIPTPKHAPTPTVVPTPPRQVIESPEMVEVSSEYGFIEAQFNGSTDQLVIIIGENHANYKVQQNVARIAEQLLTVYDIRLLLIEGFDDTLDTSFFDAIPDATVRREVAWAFLEAHEISGIEYAALVSGPDVKTIGVENMDLWEQSKVAVDNEPDLEDPIVQESWEALIAELVAVLEELKYTDELDEKLADFLNDKLDFVDFYDYVVETAEEESVSIEALANAYEEFQNVLNPVLGFATERDPYLAENSLATMREHKTNVALLLVGYAHFSGATEDGGLAALFESENVSYVYIAPHGIEDETTEEENRYYTDQLNSVPSAFEAWLDGFFKPKPTLIRPSQQAQVDLVGKIAFFETLVQAGSNWDAIAAMYTPLLHTGKVDIQNRFDVSEFTVYPCRVRGIKQNDTFVLVVSASGSEPKASHEDDVIARWQVGDRWFSAVKGRSANILIRRGIVATQSDANHTFVFPYEIDAGDGMAWQVGNVEVQIPNISWDTFNDLLDPEKPVEGREEKTVAASGGGAIKPPSDGGALIVFPEDPDYKPGGEGEENYASGMYFHPRDEDDLSIDSHALAIWLAEHLSGPIYNDGDPVLAKENLDRQEPMNVSNIGIVIDEESLDTEQKQYIAQIPESIEQKGVALSDVEITYALEDIPERSNILLITAENDAELERRLSELGEDGRLQGKYVVLFTCGDEGLHSFVDRFVKAYGLTGLRVHRDKIHAKTLPFVIGKLYELVQIHPDMSPSELIDLAIEDALKEALDEDLRQNFERLKNGWNQLSRHLEFLQYPA